MPTIAVKDRGVSASISYSLGPPDPPGWALSWVDEFDGSALDTTKWKPYVGTLSYDLPYYSADNLTVSNSCLHISTKRQALGGRQFTSGYIQSLFTQQFGRFEARIKLNTQGYGTCLWPAFWMRPNAGQVTGEIDIMEAYDEPGLRSDYRSGSATWTIHTTTAGGVADKPRPSGWTTPPLPAGTRLSDDWHTYGVEWTATGFALLFDGQPIQYADAVSLAHTKTGMNPANFAAPFQMRLQTQLGDTAHPYWIGANVPADAVFPDLLVDWVRVYRKVS